MGYIGFILWMHIWPPASEVNLLSIFIVVKIMMAAIGYASWRKKNARLINV